MRTTSTILIRLTTEQRNELQKRVNSSQFHTIASFVRDRVFGDYSVNNKLDRIIQLLEEKNDR